MLCVVITQQIIHLLQKDLLKRDIQLCSAEYTPYISIDYDRRCKKERLSGSMNAHGGDTSTDGFIETAV